MENFSDVIVIGGGPCGVFAAFNLAKHGVNVTVYEEHKEIGVPSHCAGHLSIKGLKNLGFHSFPNGIVENVFYGAIFHSPKGRSFSIRFPKPATCVVNRALFDKYIAEMAKEVGVQFYLDSRVESLIVEHGFVKGISILKGGKYNQKFAKIVIDAEGISSRILKLTGLSPLKNHALVYGVQAEVDNVKNMTPDMVEIFLGNEYALGFYAWLIPKTDEKAKIGLATKTGNPKELLKKLMFTHPVASKKLCNSRLLQTNFHCLTLGGPIPKAYTNGFLAVGDVASQVKPTTGGGVILGMTCARIAAEVALEALSANNFSAEFLSTYQERCDKILGFDMKTMLKIRKMLDGLSDVKIDNAINFCRSLKLDKLLQNVEDIDFQGRTLLSLLHNPKVFSALLYFFLLYLSANL